MKKPKHPIFVDMTINFRRSEADVHLELEKLADIGPAIERVLKDYPRRKATSLAVSIVL